MPAPSTILDRPEFAILRRLTVEQLRRIEPETSGRYGKCAPKSWGRVGGLLCPLEQAFEWGSTVTRGNFDVAYALGKPRSLAICNEAHAFIDWNDEHPDEATRKADLAAAVSAALAEQEGADARP